MKTYCVTRKKIIGRDYVRAIVQINADVLFAYYFHFRKIFINLKNPFFKDAQKIFILMACINYIKIYNQMFNIMM